MDGHSYSPQVEVLSITDSGRRRRWAAEEKIRIVEESFARPGRCRRRLGGMRSRGRFWRGGVPSIEPGCSLEVGGPSSRPWRSWRNRPARSAGAMPGASSSNWLTSPATSARADRPTTSPRSRWRPSSASTRSSISSAASTVSPLTHVWRPGSASPVRWSSAPGPASGPRDAGGNPCALHDRRVQRWPLGCLAGRRGSVSGLRRGSSGGAAVGSLLRDP